MHMPLQSGSTKVLRDMKRGYTKEWFLDRAMKLREMVPDVHISTDVIVAFPTETKEDFLETLEVVEKVRFEQMFSFKYSPRPLTPASNLEQVEPKEASDRLKTLQDIHTKIIDEITLAQKGKVFDVYFEELRGGGMVAGRSDNNFMINVKGSEELLGKTKKVVITEPKRMVLYGELIK